tara:strand:- start:5 stop:355 length:351 start_codon:yes stop_codon:yes gene_type:complete
VPKLSEDVTPIWERIREATADLSESERSKFLQDICGVRQSSVSRWRVGTNDIALEHVKSICARTGFCVAYIMDGTGPARQEQPDIDQLMRKFEGLSEEGKERVLEFLEFQAGRDAD